MTTSKSLILACGVIAVLSITLGGCGGSVETFERAFVSGKVAFDGEPLKSGTIRFIPEVGTEGPPWSTEIVDGSYSTEATAGPAVGNHRIEIDCQYSDEFAMDDEAALERLEKSGEEVEAEMPVIPRTYNTNTTLSGTVTKAGPNEFNFDLESQD